MSLPIAQSWISCFRDGESRIESSLLHSGGYKRSQRGAETSDNVKIQNEFTPDSDACIHSVKMQVAALTARDWVDKVSVNEWLDDVGVRVI